MFKIYFLFSIFLKNYEIAKKLALLFSIISATAETLIFKFFEKIFFGSNTNHDIKSINRNEKRFILDFGARKRRRRDKYKKICYFIIALTIIGIWKSQLFTLQNNVDISVDYKYIGQIVNNKPDGWGALYNEKNQICYIGHFRNGKYDGEGKKFESINLGDDVITYICKKGTFYDGYSDGEIQCFEYSMKRKCALKVYDGGVRLNSKNGAGEQWIYDNAGNLELYVEGFWLDNKKNGFCIITEYVDEKPIRRYMGNVYEDKFWGKGILQYEEEGEHYIYSGNFKNGMRDGTGIIYLENGSVFIQGIFEEDIFKTEMKISSGNIFPDALIWGGTDE